MFHDSKLTSQVRENQSPQLEDVIQEVIKSNNLLEDSVPLLGIVSSLDDLKDSIEFRDFHFRRSGLASLFENDSAIDRYDLQSFQFLNRDISGNSSSTYRLIREGNLPLPVENHEDSEHIFENLRNLFSSHQFPLIEVSRIATNSQPRELLRVLSQLYQFGLNQDVGTFIFGMSERMFNSLYSNVGAQIEGKFDRYLTIEVPCVIATWRVKNTNSKYKRIFERSNKREL